MHRNPHKAAAHVQAAFSLFDMKQFRQNQQRRVRAGQPTFNRAYYLIMQREELAKAQAAEAERARVRAQQVKAELEALAAA